MELKDIQKCNYTASQIFEPPCYGLTLFAFFIKIIIVQS